MFGRPVHRRPGHPGRVSGRAWLLRGRSDVPHRGDTFPDRAGKLRRSADETLRHSPWTRSDVRPLGRAGAGGPRTTVRNSRIVSESDF
jgi:hypothetical protein